MDSIAVIDDGINEKLFNIAGLEQNIEITHDLAVRKRILYNPFLNSHGTKCAAIIKKLVPTANLISIKISNDSTKRSTKSQLIKALEWCGENHIRLVNLSMGTVDYRDFSELTTIVNDIVNKGTILVAAYNNFNIYTCPASLPNVFGVCHARSILVRNQFLFYNNSGDCDESCIIANSNFQITDCFGKLHSTGFSNSFAAPLVTTAVYKILQEDPAVNFNKIRAQLQKISLKTQSSILNGLADYSDHLSGNIQKPFIAVCHADNQSEKILACEITACFKSDGYKPLVFSDNEQDIKCNPEMIPLQYYYGIQRDSISSRTLLVIEQIYDPDIFIVSLSKQNLNKISSIQFDLVVVQTGHIREGINIYTNAKTSYLLDRSNLESGNDTLCNFQVKTVYSMQELYNEIIKQYMTA